ncbi:hypothetical protein KNE206_11180 [Kitasatospora sp. NE20-6]|uniref:GNAT family N-acetyltransferase n=1 Tax=Kitasatospora sp. NE20-6 TaxID=2859066 RepID=UPI0034DC2207
MTLAVRPSVRRATEADADALYRLSEPFMRGGALRRRTIADYRAAIGWYLVVPGVLGPDGCAALRPLPPDPVHPAAGVLYNLCVRAGRQGAGLGRSLVEGVLDEAARQGVREVFTATTGDGRLFHRYGFRPVPPALAPASWAAALDPARGSRVHRWEAPAP